MTQFIPWTKTVHIALRRIIIPVTFRRISVRQMASQTNGVHEVSQEKRKIPIAVVQFTATADKLRNLDVCTSLIRKAKDRKAEVIFLPENFDYITENSADVTAFSEPLNGPTITTYRQLAKELNVWLSLGGYHKKDEVEPRAHNCHLVVNNEGEIVEIYQKTHLFVVDIPGKVTVDESRYCIPGERIAPPVPTPAGLVGLMTCYDLRFPEIAGILRRQGCEILAYPAAFTFTTGVAHWEPLLRARAIENQCYVVAAAQCGTHAPNRESFGHAMIVNPWGTVVAQCQEGPGIAMADIDLDYLYQIRKSMPVLSHRRHDLYTLTEAPIRLPDFSTEFHDFGGHVVSRNEVFFETRLSLALVNLKPIVPGHCLCIPKRRVEKFTDLAPAEIADLFHVVQKVEKMLEEKYALTSTTICVQDGFDAGQTVKHVHVHIVPRRPKDFERDDIYKELESHDKGDNRKPRTPAEMGLEARDYRKIMYGSSLKWGS